MPVKRIIPGQKVTPGKLGRARELRAEMTGPEALLWNELRAHRLGVHFRRQQIVAGFIVDFYCHAAGLVIEVDGASHKGAARQEADSRRDAVLRDMGLRVAHFQNSEIEQGLRSVITRVRTLLSK